MKKCIQALVCAGVLSTLSWAQEFPKTPKQETLAEASAFLLMYEGNPNVLREHGGLPYNNYTNKPTRDGRPIGHFRITQGDRVSCTDEDDVLRFRHFGAHDYVNGNP